MSQMNILLLKTCQFALFFFFFLFLKARFAIWLAFLFMKTLFLCKFLVTSVAHKAIGVPSMFKSLHTCLIRTTRLMATCTLRGSILLAIVANSPISLFKILFVLAAQISMARAAFETLDGTFLKKKKKMNFLFFPYLAMKRLVEC